MALKPRRSSSSSSSSSSSGSSKRKRSAPKRRYKNPSHIERRLKPLLPLLSASKKQRKSLLGRRRIVSCLCEISKNVLNNNIPLTKERFGRLKKHKNKLRQLNDPKISYKQKTKILQSGGFIPMLLPLAAKLLVNYLIK